MNFGKLLPCEAAIAEVKFDKENGWKIKWRKFNSGAEINAAMVSGEVSIAELGRSLWLREPVKALTT